MTDSSRAIERGHGGYASPVATIGLSDGGKLMPRSVRGSQGDSSGSDQPRPGGSELGSADRSEGGHMPALRAPGTTGRYLVLLRQDAVQAGMRALTDVVGLKVASTADFEGGEVEIDRLRGADSIVFDRLAVAVVASPPEQLQKLTAMSTEESGVVAVEPERVVYALAEARTNPSLLAPPPASISPPAAAPQVAAPVSGLSAEYVSGYRDAVNHMADRLLAASGVPTTVPAAGAVRPQIDESRLTWGLQATRVAESRFTGNGVRVAVLDTGLDLGHPEFAGRQITAQSFVDGEDVQDGHGHGTHCISTACGPAKPGQLPRYGIAYEAEIFAGKVLSNQGSGADGGILAGIEWAIRNGCALVSMSLGAPVEPGEGFSRVFEAVAHRALSAGTLIVAAAGNESQRPSVIAPVGHPANCPSIMAVGALDQTGQVAFFSSGGINPSGGQVDIAAPGVQVRSTWPRPTLYRTISGTSMATPHVAGIAALFAEANPDVRGGALGWLLLQGAARVALPARDVGAGLIQAP